MTTFKFTLPVGAIVGHMRHLGNGEFITNTEPYLLGTVHETMMPMAFELRAPVGADVPTGVYFTLCSDPLEAVQVSRVNVCAGLFDRGVEIAEGHPLFASIQADLSKATARTRELVEQSKADRAARHEARSQTLQSAFATNVDPVADQGCA